MQLCVYVDGSALFVKIVCVVVQVAEALTIKNTDIAKELSLPPVKLHCSSELHCHFQHCCSTTQHFHNSSIFEYPLIHSTCLE